VQANGGKVPLVFTHAAQPDAYRKITVTMPYNLWRELTVDGMPSYEKAGKIEPDTGLIRAALDRGEEVPGVRLGERGKHLRVE
jgi:hypothetical protein